jgi:hypothetical protein
MHQDTPGPYEPIDMVIITEHVEDARVRSAMAELATFDVVLGPTDRIRMLDREPLD